MVKKSGKRPGGEESKTSGDSSSASPIMGRAAQTAPSPPSKKKPGTQCASSQLADSSAPLFIGRNKHWRHISAYHGPWLQMPIDILEAVANINYNTPGPRPLDPATLFDLVKIRRLVDEATNLAVRAASDIPSPILTNIHEGLPGGFSLNSLSAGGPSHGSKLSKERKFRMREQASQKLSRAYRLDEIACSVATMQGATPLEEVGRLVLQRNPKDPDARYMHFFHEKIPSRHFAESTSTQPLTDIISDRPGEPEVLRTRAMVKVFKDDLEGAAQDLTHALSVWRLYYSPHEPSQEDQVKRVVLGKRRPQDVIVAEKDQPSSLEGQLLFQRATVYLSIACHHVAQGFPPVPPPDEESNSHSTDGASLEDSKGGDIPGSEDSDMKSQAESRKSAKTVAKRALRDYMSFLSLFDYSPDLPVKVAKDFNERLNLAIHGARKPRPSDISNANQPHSTYNLSEPFSAVPPPNMPPYPSEDLVDNNNGPTSPAETCELVTYHPLLSDALHSLLLCHCLLQTSTKELLRHAYMVARLCRLLDGYPVFQACRPPARSDWVEVIHRGENWLQLSSSWDNLCAPAPLPIFGSPCKKSQKAISNPCKAAAAAASIAAGTSAQDVTEQPRKPKPRQKKIIDVPIDGHFTDDTPFDLAFKALDKRTKEGECVGCSAPLHGGASNASLDPYMRRWSTEDGRDYPLLTHRAVAIARWVQEAPVVTISTKRKKRAKNPVKTEGLEVAVANLELEAFVNA